MTAAEIASALRKAALDLPFHHPSQPALHKLHAAIMAKPPTTPAKEQYQ